MAASKAGGFKLSLAGATSKPGFKSALEKPAKRQRLNLGDDEPVDDNATQEITGWDAAEGGAVDANSKNEKKGPRIILSLPNRNWSEEAKKRAAPARAAKPTEQNGNAPDEDVGEKKMAYGLTVFDKTKKDEEPPEPMDTPEAPKPQDDGLTEEQRLEKRAIDAIINGKPMNQNVIPVQSEEDTFHHDLHSMPEAPTFETYEAVPIEGFGAALLRGMGWKDGEGIGKDKKPPAKAKAIKRRPALLGIGAKEEAAVGLELGEWGKGKKKAATVYNPIVLKNGATGEVISEEELKARMEKQEMVHEETEKRSRSSKYDEEDADRARDKRKERKERDHRGDDDYDYERRREKDRRRDRDDEYSDRERRRDREKKKYRDDDSDRRHDKRRDDDYDRRGKDKDRHRDRRRRSRSPDSDDRREKRRERERRDRSRSRDDDDRRKRRREYDYEDDRGERKRRQRDRDEERYERK